MMTFEKDLRLKFVTDYIAQTGRVPTRAEIAEGVRELKTIYVDFSKVGFADHDVQVPAFKAESSNSAQVRNIEVLETDIKLSNKLADHLAQSLDQSQESFRMAVEETNLFIESAEQNLDLLLLNLTEDDVFVSGFLEKFDPYGTGLVLDRVDALVEDGRASANYTGFETLNYKLETTALGDGILSSNRLNTNDGFQYIVNAVSQKQPVFMVLDIETDGEYIDRIRLVNKALRTNDDEFFNVYVSNNAVDYDQITPAQRTVDNVIDIALQRSAKYVRVVLNKQVADAPTTSFNQWVYIWSFQEVLVLKTSTATNDFYTLVGKYTPTVGDEPVKVSKVLLDVCVDEPDGTAVDWFVSKDGLDWKPINPYGSGNTAVTLASQQSGFNVLKTQFDEFDILKGSTLGLNDHDFMNLSLPMSTRKEAVQILLGKNQWLTVGEFYTCYVYAKPGTVINFGPRKCFVNDHEVSGKTELPAGWFIFKTHVSNWQEVETGAIIEEQLAEIDPLFPFNHKLLIEGYDYDEDYKGMRPYSGYSFCQHVPKYNTSSKLQVGEWTFHKIAGTGLLIEMPVNPNHFTNNQVILTSSTLAVEDVWVKAIIKTSSTGASPVIHWFRGRCI